MDSNHRTRKGADLQSDAFGHFANPPQWCRREDLNPQPTDYKSVALPVELHRHMKLKGKTNGMLSFRVRHRSPCLRSICSDEPLVILFPEVKSKWRN